MSRIKVVVTGGNGDMAYAIGAYLGDVLYDVYLPSRFELDVRDPIMIAQYMNKVKPDVLVNCAGHIKPSPLKDLTIGQVEEHFKVNAMGPIYCAQYAFACGAQVAVNIGSTSAFEGREEWGLYCASKASLMSLTETWASEGYRCIAIHPARTKTKMRKELYGEEDPDTLMAPIEIGKWVRNVIINDPPIANGSHIILKKDRVYILPMRSGV
jgi:3-oxoacyl-[acyl-carrier protein] reductase